MPSNFHETYSKGDVKPPSERSTALVFAVVALLVAFLWRNEPSVPWWALGIAAALALVSLIAPGIFRPLNILWFKFGLLLHRIVNPFVMLVLFVFVFIPAGAIMRLWHDPLRSQRKPEAVTYWIDHATERAATMTDQF